MSAYEVRLLLHYAAIVVTVILCLFVASLWVKVMREYHEALKGLERKG